MIEKRPFALIIFLSVFLFSTKQPTVALVLSGGAAKGYAHLPVIEMIDSLNINIDMIVGTSIGANVGALYAVGYDSKKILELANNTDWSAIFLEETNRKDMSYLHKKNDSKYQLDFNLKGLTPSLPSSIVYGQKAYLELSKVLGQYEYINNFEEFFIPFYCNAADLVSGNDVLLSDGSIISSVRASTSIPSIFAPVDYKNYLLVDGGVTNNLPVNIAKSKGADIVLAVSVASGKPNKEEIKSSFFDVLAESVFIHSSDLIKKNMDMADYSLSIKMPKGNSANFTSRGLDNIYKAGKRQVYENIEIFKDLKKIAGPKKNRKKLKKLDDLNLVIREINIYGNDYFESEFIKNNLGTNINDTLDLSKIHYAINNLYGLGIFNNVRYELKPDTELNTTTFNIFVDETESNKLQAGLKWDYNYELIAAMNLDIKNFLYPGFLLKNEFQFPGITRNELELSYNQTIGGIPYYPYTRNTYDKKIVDSYGSDGERNTELSVRSIKNEVGLGFVLSKNLGFEISSGRDKTTLSSFPVQEIDYKDKISKMTTFRIDIDSRDNAFVTREGIQATLEFQNMDHNKKKFQNFYVDIDFYKTWARQTFRIHFLSRDIDEFAPVHDTFLKGYIDRTAGFNPYFLNSYEMELSGFEWKYHYKSMYLKLFFNNLSKLKNSFDGLSLMNTITTRGFGISMKTPFGPLDLIWARGPKKLHNNTHNQSFFYVNVGYKF